MEQNVTKKQKNPVKVEANFLLVIGITGLVSLVLNLIALILFTTNNVQAANNVNYAAFPAGVAEIVFIILNFTKWKTIRDKTKIDYRCVTLAYILPLASAVILGIVSLTPVSNAGHIAIIAIAAAIDLYVVIYSFILQSKVRAYA